MGDRPPSRKYNPEGLTAGQKFGPAKSKGDETETLRLSQPHTLL